MAATKSRAFTGIVYPDSAPENWQEILRDSLGMWLISPRHEPDPVEDFETGAIKTLKPHWHVMYLHGGAITPKAGRNIFESYPWIVTPKKAEYFQVGSVRNLSRYFCHLDQPEKEQWSQKPDEVLTCLNNFPLDLERELTRADKRALKKAAFAFIRDRSVTEFSELCDTLMNLGDWDLFDYVTDHSTVIQHYLMSVRKSGDLVGGSMEQPVTTGGQRPSFAGCVIDAPVRTT